MTVFVSTQAGLGDGLNSVLNEFGKSVGIPGFPEPGVSSNTPDIQRLKDFAGGILSKLRGETPVEKFDPNYVGTGRQLVVGGNIQQGKTSPLEEGNVRQVYSQTPNISIIVKKRPFSSLKNLYDPKLMDPAEKWLLRATKRLISRKCSIMADYERLNKIDVAFSNNKDTSQIISALFAQAAELDGDINSFTSATILEKSVQDRRPVAISTYFTNQSLPVLEELGPGTGVFEITTISNLNTNLDLDGNGNASFNLEDPYHILFVTEEDIESAIRDTALSNFVDSLNQASASSLATAQMRDSLLSESRRSKSQSAISFTVNIGGKKPVTAVIDSLGFEISPDNLEDVPEAQALDSDDQSSFEAIYNLLETYSQATNKTILSGFNNINGKDIKEQIKYTRSKMRLYYLGKYLIQPMDTIHMYIDGGTRRNNEGNDINNNLNNDPISIAGNILGLQDEAQIDNSLLRVEWENEAKGLMKFEDFKKLRSLQTSGEGAGFHVFGGIVGKVTDKYDAESGKYSMSVSVQSNMEWLRISRYNAQPSLDQTQGIVYDPLTPFKINTDPATGLPTGKPELLDANLRRLGSSACKLYFNNGPSLGSEVTSVEDMNQDVRPLGGNLIALYQHAPGLVYRWKEGIMTAVYDMQTTDPLNRTRVDNRQLRRDVGFFASHTAFDNMDAANIISVMVTGFPYNPSTFVQSAIQTGAFVPDTTLNSKTDFFSTFLEIQRSVNYVHGSFQPFRSFNTDPADLANAIRFQRQLTGKSNKLTQLRNQEATILDRIRILVQDAKVSDVARTQLTNLNITREKITKAEEEFSSLVKTSGKEQEQNIIRVAGDDITFDLEFLDSDDRVRLFGDRMIHAVLRRREDVINNRDKNYLIISDEYDKDFDIQAFALRLREQSPDLFKSDWQSVYQLCQTVANTLNFEFFANTQGHLEFRPPQYNRTPVSVLEAMFRLSSTAGIKVYPDFLSSLFEGRERNLVKDIEILEWQIRLKAALLGASSDSDVQDIVFKKSGSELLFLSQELDAIRAAAKDRAQFSKQRLGLLEVIRGANASAQLLNFTNEGLFSVKSQINLQRRLNPKVDASSTNIIGKISAEGNEGFYNTTRKKLVNLTGRQLRNFPEFNDAKIGASRNGQTTPATDVARIISDISGFISRRSRLLRTLEKVLEQSIEIGQISEGGKLSLGGFRSPDLSDFTSGAFSKLVQDDTKNTLGHLSGSRFVIRDDVVKDFTFEEAPPAITTVSVSGTDPIVGEPNGGIAGGMPLYLAYGVDFDSWRQYGWRAEKPFNKPFFWSAELQCASYAVMLLSRQRADILKGNITVMGNEFYQLGDVVYVVDRQMLYYVHGISHQIGYDNSFSTSLTLRYGHPPGEYIPTPLDVIGKGLTTKAGSQSAYRIRRERPRNDFVLGVVKFDAELDSDNPLAGSHGARNFNILKNAAIAAKKDIDPNDTTNSPRIYVVGFGSEDMSSKVNNVKSWFLNPERPGASSGIGIPSPFSLLSGSGNDLAKYKISSALLNTQLVRQCLPKNELNPEELEAIRKGIVADEQSFFFDEMLNTVVEIRLRLPPAGGWTRSNQ